MSLTCTSCVVCAVFRIVYIASVNMTSNITGTMPATAFLFTFEPNLAVLCVSIPMLRPFTNMFRKRAGGSRLHESNEGSGMRRGDLSSGKLPSSRSRSQQLYNSSERTIWEMDSFYPASKVGRQDVTITCPGDDSGSEKSLTATGRYQRGEIRVETSLTMKHH